MKKVTEICEQEFKFSGEVGDRIEKQYVFMDDVVSQVKKMVDYAQATAARVETVAGQAEDAKSSTHRGIETVAQVIEAMGDLAHQIEHSSAIVAVVDEITTQLHQTAATRQDPDRLVRDWLRGHIQGTDCKYAKYILAQRSH